MLLPLHPDATSSLFYSEIQFPERNVEIKVVNYSKINEYVIVEKQMMMMWETVRLLRVMMRK